MARTKIKSAHCRICGARRKFVKEGASHTAHLVASKLTMGLWLPGYAVAGAKSALGKYRCDTCGSVEGARPPRKPASVGSVLTWIAVGTVVMVFMAVAAGR